MGDAESLSQVLRETRLEDAQKYGKEAYHRFWKAPYSVSNYLGELAEIYRSILSD
jgi:hypothetical protein